MCLFFKDNILKIFKIAYCTQKAKHLWRTQSHKLVDTGL